MRCYYVLRVHQMVDHLLMIGGITANLNSQDAILLDRTRVVLVCNIVCNRDLGLQSHHMHVMKSLKLRFLMAFGCDCDSTMRYVSPFTLG